MAKKNFDPKAKAKKQKIIAGVLGVLLLGVLGISIPMTLKMMNPPPVESSSAAASTPAATTPGAPVPLAPPSLDGSTPTAAAPPSGTLVDSDAPTASSFSRLVSFERFDSKDPFAPQVSENGLAPGASPTGSSGGAGSEPAIKPGKRSGGSSDGGSTSEPKGPPPMPTTAAISVNGAPAEAISVDMDFPRPPAEALFHLVALTRTGAKISIAGGSYATGAPSATVTKGKPLTLVNTADGTRYEIRLLWLGVGAPPPSIVAPATTGGATTPAASPPAAPTGETATTTTTLSGG